MIDSVRLFTPDFGVKSDNDMEIHTISKRGQEASRRLVYNSQAYQVTVKRSNIDGRPLLYFQASLPKLVHGSSLYEISEADRGLCQEKIQTGLEDIGVDLQTEPTSMELSRVDICRNMEVSGDLRDYLGLLEELSLPQKEKRDIAGETVLFYNKSQEVSFYNKVAEVRHDPNTSERYRDMAKILPENILRMEARLKRKKVIQRELGVSHFGGIFDRGLCQAKLLKDYDRLLSTFHVTERLLHKEFTVEAIQDRLDMICQERQRGAFSHCMEEIGSLILIELFRSDWTAIEKLVKSRCRPKTASRIMRELRHCYGRVGEKERDLLLEIRQKIAA